MGIKGARGPIPSAFYLAVTARVAIRYGEQRRVDEDDGTTCGERQVHTGRTGDAKMTKWRKLAIIVWHATQRYSRSGQR